jgi:spore protease
MFVSDLIMDVMDAAPELRAGGNGITQQEFEIHGGKMRVVEVADGARHLLAGKLPGRYVTLEWPAFRSPESVESTDQMVVSLRDALQRLLLDSGLNEQATVLVVGLGNRSVTPDALGPAVVERVMVTRHYMMHVPHLVKPGTRPVCAIAPGVLGTTGMETSDVIQGVVQMVKPDAMLVIDALATTSLDRLHASVQMTNTGIQPGSGIGNKRKPFTREVFGIPVIAIGMPTVIYAKSLLATEPASKDQLGQQTGNRPGMDSDAFGDGLILTPKTTGQLIEFAAEHLADVINRALHPPY